MNRQPPKRRTFSNTPLAEDQMKMEEVQPSDVSQKQDVEAVHQVPKVTPEKRIIIGGKKLSSYSISTSSWGQPQPAKSKEQLQLIEANRIYLNMKMMARIKDTRAFRCRGSQLLVLT